MKINEKTESFSTINERLKDVLLIICVLSHDDSPNVVFEDIVALSALSPDCEIRIVSETEVDGVYNAVGKLKEIAVIPPKEARAELRQFFLAHKEDKANILYCRNAEKSPVIRKYIENVNAGITIFFGNPPKKPVLKGQTLRIEDETAILKNVMSFIPDTKIKWKLSAEIIRIIKTFLKERGVKKNYFCVDVSLEENFYEFFRNYDGDNITFLFVGNSTAFFSNEKDKIIYTGDISQEYSSALVSLSCGCLIYEDETLLTEVKHFEKKFLHLDKTTMDVDLVKKFIDENR